MSSYEEIVKVMRTEGSKDNPKGIQLADMTGATSCNLGGLKLTAEDLYISDRLMKQVCTEVSVNSSFEDKSTYSSALKAGDTVAISKVNANSGEKGSGKYVILERVVSAS